MRDLYACIAAPLAVVACERVGTASEENVLPVDLTTGIHVTVADAGADAIPTTPPNSRPPLVEDCCCDCAGSPVNRHDSSVTLEHAGISSRLQRHGDVASPPSQDFHGLITPALERQQQRSPWWSCWGAS